MSPFYGGGEEFAVRLANCLQDDFDIEVICRSNDLAEKVRKSGARIQLVQAGTFLAYINVLMKLLRLQDKHRKVLLLNGQGPAYLSLILPRVFKKVIGVQHTSI